MSANRLIPRGLPPGVWILAAASAVVTSGFGMVVPLIPAYGSRLGASHLQLGLLVAGFFAGRLAAHVPAGFAADRLGRRPVLLVALAGYVATCIGYALAGSTAWLIAFRVLQGLSSAFFTVAARSLVSDLCPRRIRGTGQGVMSSSVNLGFVTGPVIGALAAERLNITVPFWAAAGLAAAAWVAIVVFLKPRPAAVGTPPGGRTGRHLRAALGSRRVRLLSAANLCFLAGMSVIMTLFPIAGELRLSGGIGLVGIAFTAAGLTGMLIGPFAGRISDLVGRPPMMALGALLAAAEGAALLGSDSSVAIVIGFALGGLGAASFSNGLYAAVGDLTARSGRGVVTGLIGMAGEVGGIVGSLAIPQLWRVTDLYLPFGAQVGCAAIAAACALWLIRLRVSRRAMPVAVRETVIPT